MRRTFLATIAFLPVVSFAVWGQSPPPPSDLPSAQDTLGFLNRTIDWYRHFSVEQQLASSQTENLFLSENRATGRQILRLAFDFARAEAQLLASKKSAPEGASTSQQPAPPPDEASRFEMMTRLANEAGAQVQQSQAEIAGLKQKLEKASGRTQRELQAQLDEAQSVLGLAETREQTYRSILQTVSEAGGAGGGTLLAQIDQLEKSFPEIGAETAKSPAPAAPAASAASAEAATSAVTPAGIINLAGDLFSLARKRQTLTQTIQLTDNLMKASQKLRTPLVKEVTQAAQQGEEIAKQESADPTTLEQHRRELDALTANLKQVSTVVVPLAQQSILFGLYQSSLERWRGDIDNRSSSEAWSLFVRVGLLALALAAIFTLGHFWRRATLRYVPDMRRRHQFLVLRRIVIWSAAAVTVALSLATELGSLATFAGLITAGIAVALQNVILSVAGYFFLIGRYGVRIGDRIQIGGVTGTVVEIGLVRLHLMELTGSDNDRQPTGRIVVFSNSIVFQANAGFYKQIPGTNFVWHAVTLNLEPDSDYEMAETRLLEAVQKVYGEYRDEIEQQYRSMQRTFNFAMDMPKPRSRLRLTQSGLEVVIRYPLELEHSAEIDDKITRELMEALDRPPKLKLIGSGKPNILPVSDPAHAT